MSIVESIFDNHYEGTCDSVTCPLCKLKREEITQEQFDEIFEDV